MPNWTQSSDLTSTPASTAAEEMIVRFSRLAKFIPRLENPVKYACWLMGFITLTVCALLYGKASFDAGVEQGKDSPIASQVLQWQSHLADLRKQIDGLETQIAALQAKASADTASDPGASDDASRISIAQSLYNRVEDDVIPRQDAMEGQLSDLRAQIDGLREADGENRDFTASAFDVLRAALYGIRGFVDRGNALEDFHFDAESIPVAAPPTK